MHAHSGRASHTPMPQASCRAPLLGCQSLPGHGVGRRVYSTALETPWPTLEAGLTPRGASHDRPPSCATPYAAVNTRWRGRLARVLEVGGMGDQHTHHRAHGPGGAGAWRGNRDGCPARPCGHGALPTQASVIPSRPAALWLWRRATYALQTPPALTVLPAQRLYLHHLWLPDD